MAKPFLTYEQQIDKLVVEKNLIVENRDYAISILKKVSYFALICGYKDPFKNSTTKKYNDGTSIRHIIELYLLDERLRDLHKKLNIKKKGIQFINGKNDLFSVVIMFKYLLYSDDFAAFMDSLKSIILQYENNKFSLNSNILLTSMGFPVNWDDMRRYEDSV